jgi:hypothetical protein
MDLEVALQRYKLDDLLLLIGERIRQLFNANEAATSQVLLQHQGALSRRGSVTVTAWWLADLAHLAIVNSNDFGLKTPSDNDLLELVNLFHHRDERAASAWLGSLADEDKELCIGVGFSQKQFWYQELDRIRSEFNRQVEILEVLSTKASQDLRLDKVCKQATGFGLRTFRKLASVLYAIGGQKTDLTSFRFAESMERLDRAITASNVRELMRSYTADYQQIRNSPLGENAFFMWPLVQASTNRVLAVNEYFLARKIADGPYWIFRNHFMSMPNRTDQEAFVRCFGELFDLYFEKLLRFYFPPSSFRRILGPAGKRHADWILEYGKWTFLIELKSSFVPLAFRKNYPDPAVIRGYLLKLSDGVSQLDATSQTIGDNNQVLKILVHYEPLFVSDGLLRPIAVQNCGNNLASHERIFFSDLQDIEMLFQVMRDSPETAHAILTEKVELDIREDGAAVGREFSQVMNRHCKPEISRFVHGEIDHYSSYIFADNKKV